MKPVALVTGARKGIGRHLAERLAGNGYEVVGCSREEPDWTAGGVSHIRADVSDEAQVKHLLGEIRRKYGRLDVAINNAGIASMNHSLMVPAATIDRVMDINVRGTFLVSRESAKLMRTSGGGRIVNLSTIAVALSLEGESAYVASKSAVEALTRVMSRELADFKITVNAVGPTPIDTDLIRGVPKDRIKQLVDRLAIKRLGTLEDVYNVVEFFIRPGSDYITGQVIYLGGG